MQLVSRETIERPRGAPPEDLGFKVPSAPSALFDSRGLSLSLRTRLQLVVAAAASVFGVSQREILDGNSWEAVHGRWIAALLVNAWFGYSAAQIGVVLGIERTGITRGLTKLKSELRGSGIVLPFLLAAIVSRIQPGERPQ